MSAQSASQLADRVVKAARAALAAQKYVAPLDVLVGVGWIDPGTVSRWRQGRLDCLEAALQTRPSRVLEAMKLLGAWAAAEGLVPSETEYMARAPGREALRFSGGGDPSLERLYRTHWLSGALSPARRDRLAEKASRPPELIVIQPLRGDWACHRCGGGGDLLMMAPPGPTCLRCAGLDDLEFLPTGDASLTRRAKATSARYAVVVRFSKARGRYERQGLLVEPGALAQARRSIAGETG